MGMGALVGPQLWDIGLPGNRDNFALNSNFTFNSRALSGTVTLANYQFGHDCWFANVGSGNTTVYTFARPSGNFSGYTLNITQGVLAFHVPQFGGLQAGTYVLSWSGTANGQLKASLPNSSYSPPFTGTSPQTIVIPNDGYPLTAMFSSGTLTNVKLERVPAGQLAAGIIKPSEYLEPDFWDELGRIQAYNAGSVIPASPSYAPIKPRSTLNIASGSANSLQAYPVDRYISLTGAATASGTTATLTLPAANLYPVGTQLVIADDKGLITTNPLLINPASSSDTIASLTKLSMSGQYSTIVLTSDGVSNWTIVKAQGLFASTAATLATYTGAAGTLAVDTTNSRLQVHDGVTVGGWAVPKVGDLMGRNLIVNGNFIFNQRGYASGGALASGQFAHDRWRDITGGSSTSYTFSQNIVDTTITITGGFIGQPIDPANMTASSMWLTWVGTAKATVMQGNTYFANGIGGASMVVGGVTVNALLITGLGLGTATTVGFNGGTVGLVQFEAALAGIGPTRFERRFDEFFLCQRYFRVIGSGYLSCAATGLWNSTTQARVGATWRGCAMRATPTCVIVNPSAWTVDAQATSINLSSLSLFGADNESATFLAGIPSNANPPGVTSQGTMMMGNTNNGTISLSAEL